MVGSGMAGTPGISARVFSSLAEGRVNVMAIAQGSSELNISFAVDADQAGEAARRVHAAFQLSKIGGGRSVEAAHSDVVLLGFGRVGRALADQIGAQDGGSPVRVVGLLDRSGYVFDPAGLSPAAPGRLAQGKDGGRLLAVLGGERAGAAAALHFIASHAVSRPILVDVTAEETGDLLRVALGQGFDLVLANKKPLAGSAESYVRLLEAAQAASRRIRYEATVGAGLPVLDTCRKLMESGDRILQIEGAVSGTLGFVLSAVSEGRRVLGSRARGHGARLHRARPARRPLGPRRGAQGPHPGPPARLPGRLARWPRTSRRRRCAPCRSPAFLKRLPEFDGEWQARVARAARAAAECFATPSPPPRAACAPGSSAAPARVAPGRPLGHPQPDLVHDRRATARSRSSSRVRGRGPRSPRPESSTTSSSWRSRARRLSGRAQLFAPFHAFGTARWANLSYSAIAHE